MKTHWILVPSILALAVFSGCAKSSAPAPTAVTELQPAAGSQVRGAITFTQEANGVRVTGDVTGLTPGKHGFHVHEKGDLSAPDLTSAGGHYNPESAPHAGREAATRHVGDMGNIVADANGHAHVDYVDPHLSLTGEHSIVGRAVIVHAGEDDLKTQPTGNAGGRVAGGVIRLKKSS